MRAKPLPPAERLRELFNYDPISGRLTWKERRLSEFATPRAHAIWNSKLVGKDAGTPAHRARSGDLTGVNVKIGRELFKAHRIIWVIVHGSIPEGMTVDHRNLNPLDNAMTNLRLATAVQQAANQGMNRRNKLGFKGVRSCRGKFEARIRVGGKECRLGLFSTPELAHAAYVGAAVEQRGEFARA